MLHFHCSLRMFTLLFHGFLFPFGSCQHIRLWMQFRNPEAVGLNPGTTRDVKQLQNISCEFTLCGDPCRREQLKKNIGSLVLPPTGVKFIRLNLLQ